MIRVYLFSIAIALCGDWAFPAEFYSSRPHVREARPSARGPVAKGELNKLLRGYADYLAELHLLYRGKTRYHLGRDGEISYDLDWLLWQALTKTAPQMAGPEPQLINISRKSRNSAWLKKYLEQNKINGRAADACSLVITDTGWEGSIPEAINTLLKSTPIPAHLISSANSAFPSSRVCSEPFFQIDQITAKNREEYLDAVDEMVEVVEALPHFTSTATDYEIDRATEQLQPVSEDDQDPEEKDDAIGLQRQVAFFVQSGEPLRRLQHLLQIYQPLVAKLRESQALTRDEVVEMWARARRDKFTLFWADLREAFGKGTFTARPERLAELWNFMPGGSPSLADLDVDQLKEFTENEVARMARMRPSLLIEEILDFHRREKSDERRAARQTPFQEMRRAMKERALSINGEKFDVGRSLGEGYRGEVLELGRDLIVKVPHAVGDMRYIEVEAKIASHLLQNPGIGVKTLPIIALGPGGAYLVRSRLPKETLGENIVARDLSAEQIQKLEMLFNNAREFARSTGVGLDIKGANLAWFNDDWQLFDTGPRTSFAPYLYTLDVPDFATYLKIWQTDDEKAGLNFEQVIAEARVRETCEERLAEGRK